MRFKELRKQNKKTQKDLAKILNIAVSTYNGYETETYEPTIQTLKNIADYYNVSVDFLIGRDYNNEIGYLDEEQKNCVKSIVQLNRLNLMKASSYILGLLATQS